MSFGNCDCAVYSDLNPLDGGQSLYPMSTVYICNRVVQWNILTIFKLYSHIYKFTAQCKDSANYLPYS